MRLAIDDVDNAVYLIAPKVPRYPEETMTIQDRSEGCSERRVNWRQGFLIAFCCNVRSDL